MNNLQLCNPLLAEELEDFQKYRHCLTYTNHLWIKAIQALPWFNGYLKPGKRASDDSNSDIHVAEDNQHQISPDDNSKFNAMQFDVIQEDVIETFPYEPDDQLICDEMETGHTIKDVEADDWLNEDISQLAEIMEEIRPPVPVKAQ